MIDFATLQGLTIPEGVVTQIADASGRVLWMVNTGGGPVILEVEKITSDTYAGETTYTGEEFILLDIYPKTNGTVSVTYGGLTKTITDTSGAEEPNAQQVFFGTFNGVSDSVATPASGELTIEGDCVGFGCPFFKSSKYMELRCVAICKIMSFGAITEIPDNAFTRSLYEACDKFNQASIRIPSHIKRIGTNAFSGQSTLQSVYISNGVKTIGGSAFSGKYVQSLEIPASVESIDYNPVSGYGLVAEAVMGNNIISVAEGNSHYKIDGNCLIEIATNRLLAGFADSIVPDYVTMIGDHAFNHVLGLASVYLPATVTSIGGYAFFGADLTSITIPEAVTNIKISAFTSVYNLTSVTFENTLGWYVTEMEGGDASTGTAIDVSDPATNVTMLTATYNDYYWYRS